jgi:predicted RNA-binding Zn ribbon-like protein
MLPTGLRERPAARAKQVAGRLCLDFANLAGGWLGIADLREERLTDYADLLAWSWKACVLDDADTVRLWRESRRRRTQALAVFERARRLRDAIHAVAWHFDRGQPQRAADLDVLAREARLARSRQRLEPGRERLAWRLEKDRQALDSPLWPIALSAESYFTSADLSRLHSCPGESCGWHFEDQTRNRSRQWCDMRDCGNVAKLRRFRSRQRARRMRARR